MSSASSLAVLLQSFFTQRLMQQRQASPYTIASYRDTFRLLLKFTQKRVQKAPAQLAFEEVDAPLIAEFLQDLEKSRGTSPRSRNLRLTAIRSFFRHAAYESPAHAAQIQRVLAIPSKRYDRIQVEFLTRPEIDALLKAPDAKTWAGQRDYLLLLVAITRHECTNGYARNLSVKDLDVIRQSGALPCARNGNSSVCCSGSSGLWTQH
jgi:site-specific recombinase XerD